jgi:hypothetical protein
MAAGAFIARKEFGMSRFDEVGENKCGSNRRSSRAERMDRYLAESDISIDAHVRHSQLALAEAMRGRVKIYLDTNYWVNFRKADAGFESQQTGELLALLRQLVTSGRAICPLSESSFIELLPQTDPESRRATAVIMDTLSLGVALIEPRMRMGTEVSYFFHDKSGQCELYPLEDLVWCKAAFVVGFTHPTADPGNDQLMLAIQKGCFDELWDTPLIELIDRVDDAVSPAGPAFTAMAEQLNASNAIYAHEIKSFQQAYRAEAFGVADLFGDVIAQSIHAIGVRAGALAADVDYALHPDTLGIAKRLVGAALEKDKARDTLRSLHIQASLHAATRWNKQRKLDGHDILDMAHASAGLGYCDYLFTEKALADQVTQKHLQLDQRYGCTVCGTHAKAMAAAQQLAATR